MSGSRDFHGIPTVLPGQFHLAPCQGEASVGFMSCQAGLRDLLRSIPIDTCTWAGQGRGSRYLDACHLPVPLQPGTAADVHCLCLPDVEIEAQKSTSSGLRPHSWKDRVLIPVVGGRITYLSPWMLPRPADVASESRLLRALGGCSLVPQPCWV